MDKYHHIFGINLIWKIRDVLSGTTVSVINGACYIGTLDTNNHLHKIIRVHTLWIHVVCVYVCLVYASYAKTYLEAFIFCFFSFWFVVEMFTFQLYVDNKVYVLNFVTFADVIKNYQSWKIEPSNVKRSFKYYVIESMSTIEIPCKRIIGCHSDRFRW